MDAWTLHHRFEPSELSKINEKQVDNFLQFGSSITLAENGNRLAIRGQDVVHTYDYDFSTDMWLEHGQPVAEYQDGEATMERFSR